MKTEEEGRADQRPTGGTNAFTISSYTTCKKRLHAFTLRQRQHKPSVPASIELRIQPLDMRASPAPGHQSRKSSVPSHPIPSQWVAVLNCFSHQTCLQLCLVLADSRFTATSLSSLPQSSFSALQNARLDAITASMNLRQPHRNKVWVVQARTASATQNSPTAGANGGDGLGRPADRGRGGGGTRAAGFFWHCRAAVCRFSCFLDICSM